MSDFLVDNPDGKLAKIVENRAEKYQWMVADEWTGGNLPPFYTKCTINVKLTDKAWGQWYSDIRGIGIDLQGDVDEIMSRMLPHEIAHTVLTRYFNRQPPRWFDEGVAVWYEVDAPKRFGGKWGYLPLEKLFQMNDYPNRWQEFYGQSYSVVSFLREMYGAEKTTELAWWGQRIGYEEPCSWLFKTNLKDLNLAWRNWHCIRFLKRLSLDDARKAARAALVVVRRRVA